MGYKVLYRKYRPSTFDDVIGQKYVIDILKNSIINDRHSHAYIFTGPRGTGKTSCAKLFAKALNCLDLKDGNPCCKCVSCTNFAENPDIIELDAASNNGVDQIRELLDGVNLAPSNSKYKIYIIDEVHMLSTSAFNALLLTLEEPPEHVVFILATTDIQKVPITVLSRCQRFDFKPISTDDIFERLLYVCKKEKIKYTEDGLREIASLSSGGLRDALGMLDQLSDNGSKVDYDLVCSYFGSISSDKIKMIVSYLSEGNTEGLVKLLDEIKSDGINYSILVEKIVGELKSTVIDIRLGKISFNLDVDSIVNLILELNECLNSSSNVKIDGFILLEVILLKYVFVGNNLGNNFSPGNTEIKPLESDLKETKTTFKSVEKDIVINNIICDFDTNLRISNCFSNASKKFKEEITSVWSDFINYIKTNDKKLYSLIVDTVVQAASDKYIVISSKIDSTNDLINNSINILENNFFKFHKTKYRFVSISLENWNKEVEKYRENVKNKIKYNYVEENISYDESTTKVVSDDSSSIEDVGRDIFGSMMSVE